MTIFDVKFGFREDAPHREYFKAMISADINYINNIVEAEGFVSYERICSVMGVYPDPELIGKIGVYYYREGMVLDILWTEEPPDDLSMRYVAKIVEKEDVK